jgi:hypothetical protein
MALARAVAGTSPLPDAWWISMPRPGTLSMGQLRRAKLRTQTVAGRIPAAACVTTTGQRAWARCSCPRRFYFLRYLGPKTVPRTSKLLPCRFERRTAWCPWRYPAGKLTRREPITPQSPRLCRGIGGARKHFATSKNIPVFTSVPFEFSSGELFDLVVALAALRVATCASQAHETPGRDGLGAAKLKGLKAKITTRPPCVLRPRWITPCRPSAGRSGYVRLCHRCWPDFKRQLDSKCFQNMGWPRTA